MHCLSCDVELSDLEATRKDARGAYLDLCTHCYIEIQKDVAISNNFDLNVVQQEFE